MQEEYFIKNRKRILLISIVAFAAISIFTIIGVIINSLKTAKIEILVAPTFAKIEIDGKTYPSQKTIKAFPKSGEFQAIISADGFKTEHIPISFEKNNTTYIYASLENEQSGYDWYMQEPNSPENDRFIQVNEAMFNHGLNDLAKEHPITTIIPYLHTENKTTLYRIDYGKYENCKSDFCLKITDYTGNNKENALNYIQKHGFNPNDYEIAYENTIQNTKDNPITNYLPYNNLYSLNYSYTMNNQLLLTVDSNQTYFDSAIEKLKNFATTAQTVGSNKTISEYNIQFTYDNFSNPFENSFQDNNSTDPIEFLKNGYKNVAANQNVQFHSGTIDGNYYYTLITIGNYSEFSQVTFRTILTKNGNTWKLVATPKPLLTTTNTKDIPTSLLDKINNLPTPSV